MNHSIEQVSISTIRTLAMDAVQAANSGHPGTAMAMAQGVYTLWQEFLRFDPNDRSGPIATALCFPWVMPLCCSMPLYTHRRQGGQPQV